MFGKNAILKKTDFHTVKSAFEDTSHVNFGFRPFLESFDYELYLVSLNHLNRAKSWKVKFNLTVYENWTNLKSKCGRFFDKQFSGTFDIFQFSEILVPFWNEWSKRIGLKEWK